MSTGEITHGDSMLVEAEYLASSPQIFMQTTASDCSLLASLRKLEAPFWVVKFDALKKFGKLPRSDSKCAVLHEELPAKVKVLFLSHRWFRPWLTQEACEQQGHIWAGEPHPDDADGSKFALLIAGIESIAAQRDWALSEIAVWMDFACIDQDNLPLRLKGIRSLLGYMARCDTVIVPTLEKPPYAMVHRMIGGYGERAWTRLEAFGFYVLSLLEGKTRPELFYSAPGNQVQQLDYVLLPYTMPSTGVLTVEADRDHVQTHENTLLDVLHKSALAGSLAARGPAMVAAAGLGNSERLTELLSQPDISPDTQDNLGVTAMWSAARQGHANIVETLLKVRASQDLSAASGQDPVHCAAQEGHKKVVEVLLSFRANVDKLDKKGFTPLLRATQHNHVEVVKLLLNVQPRELEAVREKARELNFTEIVDLVSEFGEVRTRCCAIGSG